MKIDKNVPLPKRKTSQLAEKYPVLRSLEVGDSVLFEISPASVAVHTRRIGKELGQKFMVRDTPEGTRVWRSK